MEDAAKCTQCGQALPADAPRGLCPSCLLKAGMASATADVGVGSSANSGPDSEATRDTIVPESPEGLARLFPQLEIIGQLGEGGMGVVYKARQKQLDRIVALKLMRHRFSRDPQFAERFNREARALAKLNHPNIVSVYDFGMAGGQFYFIMEYVDGVNLQQMIATKAFAPQEALAIVPKLCDALQYAHDEGVVHRDIKPANILVDKKGRVKIADFGLAKIAGIQDDKLTRTNQGMGTMQYMAPEQMENAKCVDHRADIYSLGVVFYEMLTGELPLGRFAAPSEKVRIDVRLDEIVLHALERDADRRYQHVSEVKTAVESVTSTTAPQPVPAAPHPSPAAPQPPIDYVNRLIGFFMTPQPGYAKAVGYPMIMLTGIWMVVNFAVMFLVPESKEGIHVAVMSAGVIGIPLGLLVLSLRWAVMRNKPDARADNTTKKPVAAKFLGSWATWCALLLLALCLASVLVPSAVTGWLGNIAFASSVTVPGGGALSFAPHQSYDAGIALWHGQLIAAACVIALVVVVSVFASGKKLPGALALLVAGAITVGTSAYFLATFRDTHFAGAGISWHDLQAVAENRTPDADATIRMFVTEHPGFIAPLTALWEDVNARAANYLPPEPTTLAIAPVQAHQTEQPGAKWTLFLGACALLLGLIEIIGLIAQRTTGEPGTHGTAVALLVSGVAGVIFAFFLAATLISEAQREIHFFRIVIGGAACVTFVVLAVFVVRGALKMLNREDYAASRTAALCSIFSFNIVSLPIGIWALLRLSKPEVKALFTKTLPAPKASESASEIKPESQDVAHSERVKIGVNLLLLVGLAVVVGMPMRPHTDNPARDEIFSWINYAASMVVLVCIGMSFSDSWRRHTRWIVGATLLALAWRGVSLAIPVGGGESNAGSQVSADVKHVDGPVTSPVAQPSNSRSVAVRPPLNPDQILVEDSALRLLVAMRDKDDKVLRELATDSIIKSWSNALPQFAMELREKFVHEFEKPLNLWPVESLLDGDFAVVRCTSKETETKLNGWYLGLIFFKTKDGTWRNAALAGATADLSLAVFLADFKAKNMPATPKEKQP